MTNVIYHVIDPCFPLPVVFPFCNVVTPAGRMGPGDALQKNLREHKATLPVWVTHCFHPLSAGGYATKSCNANWWN